MKSHNTVYSRLSTHKLPDMWIIHAWL